MRKLRLPDWNWGAALALTALIGVVVLGCSLAPPSAGAVAQNCPANHQGQHCETAKDNQASVFFALGAWADTHHDAIEALSAVGTAAFTLALFVSTMALWCATRASVRISERALTEVERPFIFLENSFDFEDPVGPNIDKRYEGFLSFKFRNLGRSPAIIQQFTIWLSFVSGRRPPPIPYDELNVPVFGDGLVIKPDGSHPISRRRLVLTANEVADLGNHRGIICLWGRVRYKDIFGKSHDTYYCWEWTALGQRFQPSPHADLNRYT